MSQNDSEIIVIHETHDRFSVNNLLYAWGSCPKLTLRDIQQASFILVREETTDLRFMYRFVKNRCGSLQGMRNYLNEYDSFRQLFGLCPTIDLFENIDGV